MQTMLHNNNYYSRLVNVKYIQYLYRPPADWIKKGEGRIDGGLVYSLVGTNYKLPESY